MFKFLIKKSIGNEIIKSVKEKTFEELKAEVIAILKKQATEEEKENKPVHNSIEKGGLPDGTKKEWPNGSGKWYIKMAGEWKRYYPGNSRGAKMSATRLIHAMEKEATTPEKLLEMIKANKERFMDQNGKPTEQIKRIMNDLHRLHVGMKGNKAQSKEETKQTESKKSEWESLSEKDQDTKIGDYFMELINATPNYKSSDYEKLRDMVKDGKTGLLGGHDDIPVDVRTEILDKLIRGEKKNEAKETEKESKDVSELSDEEIKGKIRTLYDSVSGRNSDEFKQLTKELNKRKRDAETKDFEEKSKKVPRLEFTSSVSELGRKTWEAKQSSEKGVSYKIIKTGNKYQSQQIQNGEVISYSDPITNLIEAKDWCTERNVKAAKIEESEAEKHQNRSDAMKGNQNAKKYGVDQKILDKFESENIKGQSDRFKYSLLSRMLSDMEYFDSGRGSERQLWAGNVNEQLAYMNMLRESVKEKPEWLTDEQMKTYEDKYLKKEKSADEGTKFYQAYNNPEKADPEDIKDVIDALKTDLDQAKRNIKNEDGTIADKMTVRDNPEMIKKLQKVYDEKTKKADVSTIRKAYENSKSVTGNKKTLYVGDEKVKGHWKLVEADAPQASHNENTYEKTPGFPTSKDGGTINDRDYEHDKDAQESVRSIASNFNGRALDMGEPVIVTKDGIVVSGNNRTMSSKLAAKQGTDKQYLADLKEQIEDFGFDEEDLNGFKHPRIVFEMDNEHDGDYTTEEFAKFNKTGKKSKNATEKAVEISKTIKPATIKSIADTITQFDTMGDLWADNEASQSVIQSMVRDNLIGQSDVSQYYTSEGGISAAGKEFVETVLIGSIMNENNIRSLSGEGGKSLRQKLVRAITPLIENKGDGNEYSFNNELNEAVRIAAYVNKNHDQYPTIQTYLKQGDMFEEKPSAITQKLAEMIHDGTQKSFADQMKRVEAGIRPNANGEVDIFLGKCETRDEVMNRFLEIKEAVKKALNSIFWFRK